MQDKAYVVTGRSALQIVRSIRCSSPLESRQWFPWVELPVRRGLLPGQMPAYDGVNDMQVPAKPASWRDTLQDISFPFDEVAVNRSLSLGQFSGLPKFSKRHPLELGVFVRSMRQCRKSVRSSLLSQSLPAAALVSVGDGVYVAAPELICISMAPSVGAVELAMVVMELAGSWSLSPAGAAQDGASASFNRDPITSVARIRAMADCIPRVQGRKTLLRALDMALERSASPQEAQLGLMFAQPISEGGYGMERPLMNAAIDPPESMRSYLEQRTYFADLFFQSLYADLEYESDAFHFDPLPSHLDYERVQAMRRERVEKSAADRRRLRDLLSMGVRVVPITAKDLRSREALDGVAWALARCAGAPGGLSVEEYMEQLDDLECVLARDNLFDEVVAATCPE